MKTSAVRGRGAAFEQYDRNPRQPAAAYTHTSPIDCSSLLLHVYRGGGADPDEDRRSESATRWRGVDHCQSADRLEKCGPARRIVSLRPVHSAADLRFA